MNLEESKKLLRYLAGIDGRKVTNDAAHAVHKLLQPFDYADTLEATELVVERHPDDQWISLPKVRAVLESKRPSNRPACEHGVPVGQCHDCEQGTTDEPGPPEQVQAQVLANLDLGKGRWAAHADPTQVLALEAQYRAPGVVYPDERTCLDGHDLKSYRPVMGANGRMCGHPAHHPAPPPDVAEEVDW